MPNQATGVPVYEMAAGELMASVDGDGNSAPQVVCALRDGGRISARLWAAMVSEFRRSGTMLTPGKVRYLRRLIRRSRSAIES